MTTAAWALVIKILLGGMDLFTLLVTWAHEDKAAGESQLVALERVFSNAQQLVQKARLARLAAERAARADGMLYADDGHRRNDD